MEQNDTQKIIGHLLENDAFSKWMGVKVLEAREGYCHISMTIREDMLNGFGIVHGGLTFSFGDTALAIASNSYGKICVALDVSITFSKAVQFGDMLIATAKEISKSNRIAHYHIQIHNQMEELVAAFNGTVYCTGKELIQA